MAGMLPGVEAARRRRVHQTHGPGLTLGLSGSGSGSGSSPSSRRCSFSLFSTNSSSSSPLGQQRIRTYQVDEKLGQLAREAKERLDERLRAQRKSVIIRSNSEEVEDERGAEERVRELKREVYRSKKKMKGWAKKLGWKAGEQEECAVCLDEFKVGDNLVNMPCAHTFHSTCLIPWLQTNAHCPCCRISLLS